MLPGHDPGAPDSGDAFGAFYETRRPLLLRAFSRAREIGHTPEDVLHDTMERLQRHGFERFRSDDHRTRWCITTGLNRIRDLAGSAYRKHEQLHASPASQAPYSAHVVDPQEIAVENLELARVLPLLPKPDAHVLLLARDFDKAEIGAILKLTDSAVVKRLERARKRARMGWGKMVAGFLPAAFARKLYRHAPSTGQLVACVVSVSAVAVLYPITPSPTHVARRQYVVAASAMHIAPVRALVTARPSRPLSVGSPAAAVLAARSAGRPGKPVLIPRRVSACVAHVCVASSCKGEQPMTGDRLYLKATGPCGTHTTQNTAPICQYVIDNPVVGCRRDGDPQYSVDPPPPPSPEGAPL